MSRLLRLLRTRWWLVLGVALLNVWIAGYLTDLRNRELPEWDAIAPVVYSPRLGEVDDEPVLARLQADAEGARESTSDLLEAREGLFGWETAAIEADERSQRLLFVGRGDTPEQAEAEAEELRQRFTEAGFLDEARIGELDNQLDLILDELGLLRQRIDAATATEPIDPQDELRRTLLDDEAGALRSRHAGLSGQLLGPPPEGRTIESIQEEMELIRQRLAEIQAELATLPAPPAQADGGEDEDAPPPEESLPTTIDRLQYEQLQAVYQELFIRRLEAESGGSTQPITVHESSLQPTRKGLNQALGALVGVAAALFGLAMTDRARDLVWSASDADGVSVLQGLPPRPVFTSLARPWYLRSPPGERKSGIQKLRSVVEVLEGDGGVAIGISGISSSAEDVHELAADLAVSLAVSGRQVLLIDADVDQSSRLVEFGRDRVALSELLRVPVDRQGDGGRELETQLLESTEVITNLRAVPAGRHQLDAADTLSRPEFGALLDTARRMFDLIIVSGAPASEPGAHVLSQRLDAMILMGSAGQTAVSSVVAVTRSLTDRRARLLGFVLLSRSFGLLRRTMRRLRTRSTRRGRPRSNRRDSTHAAAPSVSDRLKRRDTNGSPARAKEPGTPEEPSDVDRESASSS